MIFNRSFWKQIDIWLQLTWSNFTVCTMGQICCSDSSVFLKLGNCFQLEKVWQDNLKFTAAGAQYYFPREQDLDFCTVLKPMSSCLRNTSWTKYFSKDIFFKSSFEVWLDFQWLAHPWESGEKSLSECKKLTTLPNFVIPSQSSAFYPNWIVGNLSKVISSSLFRGGD